MRSLIDGYALSIPPRHRVASLSSVFIVLHHPSSGLRIYNSRAKRGYALLGTEWGGELHLRCSEHFFLSQQMREGDWGGTGEVLLFVLELRKKKNYVEMLLITVFQGLDEQGDSSIEGGAYCGNL